ncbi:leucine-rich repeat flightless-interacting protein 1 isoform X5 [Syngnathus scovelli]|uniref:leucine-rich repeat flightless-interacting protein 1 isoform X5 n=1 Tax=Syngnathus scovelli TaxID=161590 RepID=UPI002110C8A0|nr:leucine-rich repeat flightless-interacting protein 1 isoform X5 [Syngnathus scovelli]
MGTQGTGRKRNSNKERTTAEDDALNLIARDAEARLAAKRAARAEAREIRMRELERQQKEIFQVQKKYYGLNPKADDRSDSKWGDIEQWMEDSERYSRPSHTHTLSDDDERMSVGSRGSARASYAASSDLYSLNGLSAAVGRSPALTGSYQSSLYEDGLYSGSRQVSGSNSGSHVPIEYASYRSGSNSRTSSRANSARTSPVDERGGSVASLLRSVSGSRGLPRDLANVTIPDFLDVDDRDYPEKGSRAASALTATTLTSLGGSSSRRGSVESALTVDAESATREIKEIHELKDQIQDVESKYSQNLKEVKEALAEVEEKYRKAMVSNAQLDNEKNNLMYQVDTLKDSLMELEELLSESRRQFEDKLKDFEREKHAHSVLQFQFNDMKETLKQSEELLNEIRQLRLKQEGFAREIADLQETVEWKDKKIGALERQKEYTDAIRTERDDLREEVVKLKDILKKHGIVLGPDLSVNGDANETETDAATSGDGASPSSPAEGSSVLGSSGDSGLRSRGKEAVDQEERGQVFEEGQTSAADRLSDTFEASGSVKEKVVVQDNDATGQTVTRVNSDLEETDAIMNGNLIEIEAVQELGPQDQISPPTSCPVGANEPESSHQEQMKDSESCPHLGLIHEDMGDVIAFEENSQLCPIDGEYAEPCPRVQGVGEPQSGLQADLQSSPQEDIPQSKSCQGEDVKTSPHGDVKDFEAPEWCPQVDVKSSEWCPQVEDAKDDGHEDGNNSEPCSQVQVGQDSQSGPRVVEPECIAELQQETAEASSDDAETNVTKPAGKSAKGRGKKKKKKRRGKRKGASPDEEPSHQRDNKGGNVTTEQDKLQTEGTGAPLVNADCAHVIQCLQEATQQTEPANLHHVQESKTAQMLHAEEQSGRHLETEKVEIVQAPKESLDSDEAQEGSDPILDKDAIIDTTIGSGPGDATFGHNEGETSSPTLNDNKEDSVAQLESCDEAASESHNRVSVTSPDDIGDGLQDSSSSSALRPDSLTEVVFKQQTFTNQEDEEFRKMDIDDSLTFVQPEKSSHDLDEEETRAGLVADGQTLLCEDRFVDAALDTLEPQKVRDQVTNENLAAAEEHESMEGDHQAADLRACQQDSGEDVDDEDEKGHSFDFDDMDLDAAVELETLENPERRPVEVGDEDVTSDELQTDKNRKDSEAVAPEQTDVEMAVEVLPDEWSKNNNNSNTETPTRRDARGAAPNVLTNVHFDNMSKESHGKDGQPSDTGLPQTTGEDQIPAQAAPLAVDSVENAQDASATLSNIETPVSGKDGKENGKKGKSKGKDDCKVT